MAAAAGGAAAAEAELEMLREHGQLTKKVHDGQKRRWTEGGGPEQVALRMRVRPAALAVAKDRAVRAKELYEDAAREARARAKEEQKEEDARQARIRDRAAAAAAAERAEADDLELAGIDDGRMLTWSKEQNEDGEWVTQYTYVYDSDSDETDSQGTEDWSDYEGWDEV